MEITKDKIILVVIVAFLAFMGFRNTNKEKVLNKTLLKEVTIVENGKINKENESKLVLVSGKINYDGSIKLDELDKPINSFKVVRTVKDFVSYQKDGKKHYEWRERKEAKKDPSKILDFVYSTERIIKPQIGDFWLDDNGLKLVKAFQYYNAAEEVGGLKWNGMEYTNPGHDDGEEGDVSIQYYYFDLDKYDTLSILAQQNGNSFAPYRMGKKEIYYVFNGTVDTEEKLAEALSGEVKKGNRGRIATIVLVVLVGLLLVYNNSKKSSGKDGTKNK